jgi:hypothetical protein
MSVQADRLRKIWFSIKKGTSIKDYELDLLLSIGVTYGELSSEQRLDVH